jgi:wyosine [tRNA(Phe)-imidazoG37] synthetase (radical SAM superfamily)
LGIDPIPLKTCNWNCVYCQLGRTVPLTNERCEYVSEATILDELQTALDRLKPGTVDWITFVGSGEPTLHSGIGRLIRGVQALTDLPVAVITNGALLHQPDVREALMTADAVLPSLDAGTADLYRRLNRPHPHVPFQRLVSGLIAFRKQYQGKLWVEVMLVRGLNDSAVALRTIAGILQRVRPDAVHINLPIRPPAESWVQPADQEGIMRALAILGDVARVVHPAAGRFDLGHGADTLEAVIDIIARHPMQEEILRATLACHMPDQVDDFLAKLEASGRAQIVERYGVRFWCAAPARYASVTAREQDTGSRTSATY